jgi:NADH oxidase (H2O-forming)
MKDTNVLSVNNDVKWIGVLDEDIVTFDIVMETQHGTTYNSYFIDADKKVIIDTVKESFKEVYLNKVQQVVNPVDIDYIIVNHTEPDHSGCLKHLLKRAPKAVVYGSRQAINYLNEMIDIPFNSVAVKDGDTLDLGNKVIHFISAPNLHWPDTIYTYLEGDHLLFSCDSFGAHYCSAEMFDDKIDDYSDAFKYYFDMILKPFSKFMVKAVEKIRLLPIQTICPGHGPILRKTWKEKIELSDKYANEYIADSLCMENNILITYVSAYGYTRQMAEKIAMGIKKVVDYKINVVDIEKVLLGDLEELIVKSNAILVGSPTINQNTLLPVYKMFALINPIRDKGKKAAAFGSYGWSGEAVQLIENQLKALKLNVVMEGFSTRFFPQKDKEQHLIEFGEGFGKQLLN